MRRILLKVNMSEAAGPDNILGLALRTCANQLVDVITNIFNTSLSQKSVKSLQYVVFEKLVPVYYVYCYAPKHQDKFLVCVNLLGNKPNSDSANQRQHHSQPGLSPVCIQSQQIHRGCHLHCVSPVTEDALEIGGSSRSNNPSAGSLLASSF